VPLRGWEYYVRTAEGAQYPDSCRRPRGGGEETVILNRNEMAEGHDYLSCVGPYISPSDRYIAYATDFDGSEKYTLRVRDLTTLEDLPDEIPETSGDMCWVTDDVFLYVMLDDTHRPYQVRRHVVGSDATRDDVLYEDNDDRFFVRVVRDLAGRFVFVSSGSKITNEDHFLAIDDPFGPLTVVEPRVNGVEYETADDGENFVILTNADGATDFKVVVAPVDRPGKGNWVDLLPHRPGTRVNEVWPFKDFIAVGERRDALNTIRLIDRRTGNNSAMAYDQEVYDAQIDANREFDTTKLRYTFTSLNVPLTWIDHEVATGQSHIVKRTEVPNVDLDDYVCVREWATADDGTVIPMSILHRKDFTRDGTAPGLLYGYGSYEISIDPDFRVSRLNLVDRGLVYAIAHIRGGGEMGRRWYEDGKFLKKRNTFTDFIACARHLVDQRWVAKERLAARGGSAGGLLMGAVTNMAPELFNTIVAEVPFVDVVTTMSDETIPLTVTEWEEWGNPRDNADDYQYMKSYSPVDNVEEKNYPAIYVEAGLNDPRVQYWEPAKWVAKLRVTKTDDNPLLLKTEMGAGHGGPSGRYQAWDDEARVQAFVLSRLGADGTGPSR
jgi:oligopeptidase B